LFLTLDSDVVHPRFLAVILLHIESCKSYFSRTWVSKLSFSQSYPSGIS
jgi:hypothetical protein